MASTASSGPTLATSPPAKAGTPALRGEHYMCPSSYQRAHMLSSTINFNANYNPGNSGGSLAVYGWTTNPLVEVTALAFRPCPVDVDNARDSTTSRRTTRTTSAAPSSVPSTPTARTTTSTSTSKSISPQSRAARRRSGSTSASARTSARAARSPLATTSTRGRATA
jgi:hypothetical protein